MLSKVVNAMSDAAQLTNTITVPLERFKELEALEARLPSLLEKAKAEVNTQRFTILHERQKANPEPNRKRVLSNYHKNKEEINARRREAYRLKKESAPEAGHAASAPA